VSPSSGATATATASRYAFERGDCTVNSVSLDAKFRKNIGDSHGDRILATTRQEEKC